jgi:hypothetical protein
MTSVCSPTISVISKSKQEFGNSRIDVQFVTLDELLSLQVSASSVYFDIAYLRSVSVNDSEDLRHIFPCVFLKGELVAFGAFCLLRRDKTQVVKAIADQGTSGRIWKQALKSLLPLILGSCDSYMQILIAGNMLVSGPYGMQFLAECDVKLQEEIWHSALKAADDQFGTSSLTVVKDFLPNASSSVNLAFEGFLKVNTLPLMVMHLPANWTGFSDYLEAMSTKYRTRARAALQKAGSLTTEYWDSAQIRANSRQIHLLYTEVYKRAKFRIQPVNEAYIPTLAEAFPDGRFRFTAWKDGDKLIGFSTAFVHQNQFDAHLIGMDYTYNRSHSLYLNMIYRYIQDAIELRVNRIDFGRTAMEIKSTAGAIPQELDVMVRLKSGMGNQLAKRFTSKIKSEDWIQRHPFKLVNETNG